MLESTFQANLIKELRIRFPGCLILKNDAGYLQGIPDLTVFYGKHYAMLECKKSAKAPHRPNQDYYVEMINNMSYAAFICPENKEEILDAMEEAWQTSYRSSCNT